jgi:hypothetical protein
MTMDEQIAQTISKEQYYMLIGLLTLASHHSQALEDIKNAALEITKEEEDNWTSDAVYGGYGADELLEHLNITVRE